MNGSDIIGSIGVFLLLAAYLMNHGGMLDGESRSYQGLNVIGAGLTAYSAYLISFIPPFVVLEGTWMVVSLAGLVRRGPGMGVAAT